MSRRKKFFSGEKMMIRQHARELPKYRDSNPRRRISYSEPRTPLKKESLKNPLDILADHFGLNAELREKFKASVMGVGDAYKAEQAQASLPDGPVRDYLPRENLINYLRSDEGFGPWIAAGALTRPLIRDKAPKAYTALSNWLRTHELPDDLPIPTKSETLDRELSQFGSPEQLARVGQAVASRLRRDPR